MTSNKILLIFPKLEEHKPFHHFPFGLLAVAAPLAHHGLDFEIFDERVDDPAELDEKIREAGIIGVSMFSGYQTHCGYELLKRAKGLNPDAYTVVGGPHVSALPEQTIKSPYVDYAIAGFGEGAFYLLAKALIEEGAAAGKGIPGLHHKESAQPQGAPTLERFDANVWHQIPYHKINIEKYINPERNMAMYISHYGCPAICTFCATPEQRKWTAKPMELVRKDLDTLYEKFAYEELVFYDATLFTSKKRVDDIVEYLNRFDGMKWLADARSAELVKYSLDELKNIRRAQSNLLLLVVGLESGSARISEGVMKKGRDHLAGYMAVAKRLHQAGIRLVSGVVLGVPGETPEDLMQTIEYISEVRKVDPDFKISTTFFRPLPGTELYSQVESMGFKQPSSLEEWAEKGSGRHFDYNVWMGAPWIGGTGEAEYRKVYDIFLNEHGDIFV